EAFLEWREVPGPQRGQLIKRWSELLAEHKKDLAALVTAEVGKIPSESEGEVQEMIDICDFALGQSRMMYGATMPSERP
ncbi:aldehyde dehydrogenase family protein, partial [Rhizobium johnstonii]